jgi:hypothetical protein
MKINKIHHICIVLILISSLYGVYANSSNSGSAGVNIEVSDISCNYIEDKLIGIIITDQNGKPINNKRILITVPGQPIFGLNTNSAGYASFVYKPYDLDQIPGTYTVKVESVGTTDYPYTAKNFNIAVEKTNVEIEPLIATSEIFKPINLDVEVTNPLAPPQSHLFGIETHFFVNVMEIGYDYTDFQRKATRTYTPTNRGACPLKVSTLENDYVNACYKEWLLYILGWNTKILLTSQRIDNNIQITAQLKNNTDNTNPIPGKELKFIINGQGIEGQTDNEGKVTITQPYKTGLITCKFSEDDNDPQYEKTSESIIV